VINLYFDWICPKCKFINENTVEDTIENNTVCQGCYEEFDIAVMTDVIILEIESVKDKQKKREMKRLFG
jgi:hypothetical protein